MRLLFAHVHTICIHLNHSHRLIKCKYWAWRLNKEQRDLSKALYSSKSIMFCEQFFFKGGGGGYSLLSLHVTHIYRKQSQLPTYNLPHPALRKQFDKKPKVRCWHCKTSRNWKQNQGFWQQHDYTHCQENKTTYLRENWKVSTNLFNFTNKKTIKKKLT